MHVGHKPGQKPPSPVRGESAPLATTIGNKQVAERRAEVELQQVSLHDVDLFLKQRAGTPDRSAQFPSLRSLFEGKKSAPPSQEAQQIQQSVQHAVHTLTAVYADGLVTEAEIAALGRAQSRLSNVLKLADPTVLQMLPRDVRERLQTQLFEPVQTLLDAASRRSGRVLAEVGARDHEALLERIHKPQPSFVKTHPRDVHDPSSITRYAPGDYIAVPRSDGSLSLGVVTGQDPDGLRVEVLDVYGQLGMKKLDAATVAAANPFKIGDVIDFQGARIWVTGVGAHGGLDVSVQDRSGALSKASGGVPNTHPSHGLLDTVRRAWNDAIELVVEPEAQPFASAKLAVAGGSETPKPESIQAKTAAGALFTYRGIGYKDYNEDAAVLGVARGRDGKEIVFAGAFDQAGGMGGVPGQTGAASKAAADRFQKAADQIAQGADPAQALEAAGKAAHEDVNGFGVGAATTFAAGVIKDGQAIVLNCGDSGVLLVDKHGRIKAQTEAHNLGDLLAKETGDPNAGLHVANVVTSALGGADPPKLDLYRWPVEKGDRLVFVSDGVLDANLAAQKAAQKAGTPWRETAGDVTARDIGNLVAQSKSPADASQRLIDYARDQVETGRGKRDNVTAVVVQIN